MAQEAEAFPRAISTAMFLMAPAPPEAEEKKVWDAASRQVITLKAAPVINPDLVGISSSSSPSPGSSPLFRTTNSGRLVNFTTESGAADQPASPSGRAGCPISSNCVRTSLTGYQRGCTSPSSAGAAPVGARSGISRRNSAIGGPDSPTHPRPNLSDLERQTTLRQSSTGTTSPAAAAAAATSCSRKTPKSSMTGSRSSGELLLTPDDSKQLRQHGLSTDGSGIQSPAPTTAATHEAHKATDASDGYQGSFSVHGMRSRRSSLPAMRSGSPIKSSPGGEWSAAADGIQGPTSPLSRAHCSGLAHSASTAAASAGRAPPAADYAAHEGPSSNTYGRSRHISRAVSGKFYHTGSVTTTTAMTAAAGNTAQARADSDVYKQQRGEGLGIKGPRRPQSLYLPGSPVKESYTGRSSHTAANSSPVQPQPEGSGARRSLDVPLKQQQPQPQLYTASSLAAVGFSEVPAAIGTGTTPNSPNPKSPVKPLSLLKANSSPAPLSELNAAVAGALNRCQSVHPAHAETGSDTSRYSYKPFVPPIDLIDRRALQHAADSDCTAYYALLETLHSVQQQ